MSTRTAAQQAESARRSERAAALHDEQVRAASGSREAGAQAAAVARATMLAALDQMREATARDPIATAVATTRLLWAIVDAGSGPHTTSDSLAHAAHEDRRRAVQAALAAGMPATVLGALLGVDGSHVAKLTLSREARASRAQARQARQTATVAAVAPAAAVVPVLIHHGQTDLLEAVAEAGAA